MVAVVAYPDGHMPILYRSFVILAVAFGLYCPVAMAQECRLPQTSKSVAELIFGRNIGNKLGVSENTWARFVATEITPRFPNGFSMVDARGQWLDSDTKKIVRERSKLVTIVLDGAADTQQKIDDIVAAYKGRFRQQAVGVIIRPACVSF
jgi:hypothetical protein